MTKDKLEKEAVNHCNEVMCSICEKGSCSPFKKCKEWRDRRAGYYCGIDSREKQISELRKQHLDETLASKQIVQEMYKQIQDLQKENAELKSKNKWYSEQVCNKECAEVWRNLTKAKEIIKDQKELLDRVLSGAETLSNFAQNTLRKAEQFLKEIEK